jgi:hypothetical protein
LHRFIELAVDKFYQNLNALQVVLLGEIDGALRVFEIERLVRIGRPVPQAFQEKLRPNVLEQNPHNSSSSFQLRAGGLQQSATGG